MDSDEFVAGFDYPMFVVTAVDSGTGTRGGCLVGFATQTSIDPFRFLVCLSRRNHTYRVAEGATVLAVHVLGRDEDQQRLAALFGTRTGDEIDKFDRCSWRPGPEGVPLLTGARRRLVGRILERADLGDHAGFLLAPLSVTAGAETVPLSFRSLPALDPGHRA
ncbi:flavin reductase family protein [Actinomadura algeriensis]|uniref:Flavin reductase (DIM6/NTAB) family NADH-FMN oxidoreductase RutF n=1 Tax=Actinomadura algeriensis TaxID=1679523 RepID=A0ABR9K2F8_9ACTN|nr:flavin reductase family protein [Actinomadura algeriensis]MBE1536716.1 flavin reductase (DIM6/NTAB) family NADH-FMN oxidoreductase RutF [Actinomadura algeriensis]